MKNSILIPLLLVSSVAFADSSVDMEVTDVQAIYTTTNVNVPTNVTEEQCVNSDEVSYRRNSRGVLEEITNGGFGSTGGLLGTAASVAIIDELGGNDAAKIIGGLLGNKIGNDISDRRRNNRGVNCEIRTVTNYERRYEDHLDHYLVTGFVGSNQFQVKRIYNNGHSAPTVGDTIRVRVNVW